jgi:tetratricopeptide (TPR) repeat protein/regulation of enolase protein 1 (concanavalin A-like superfamily)
MEKPGTRIGRYKLLRVLGEGGMGIVYLAQQQKPVKREVALKVIKPGMDSKRVIARFEAEQQALALMEHPHVARVHDAGLTPSGRPYFVMEHVKGVPITEYCDRHRLTIEDRLRLFLHVCEAVQHAHQKGIIHRDIKPSNILVTIEDQEAVPKVIDFGVARAVSQPLTDRTFHTEQGQLIGTPEYMSPEQVDLSNQDVDTRTDVYSLGVVLYELVAGVLPFDPQTLREHGIDGARKVICEEEPQTPSTKLSRTSVEESTESAQRRRTDPGQLQRKLRGDLDWITLKSMEKDRTRRYASAGELATDIQRHLNYEPVMAGRPSLAYRARKFVRRRRALVTGLAAVLAVLLAGIIVSLVFAVRAQHARDEATAVAEFLLQDMFGAIDALERGGRQVSIKEILDAASQDVSSKFQNTPLYEASIRKMLGVLYARVTCFVEGERHLLRSLDIFTRELGREDPRTVEVVNQLGSLYWDWWRYREAEQYLSEALQARRRLLGSEHPDTVDSLAGLGLTYYAVGRSKEAEALLVEAYETSMRILGETDGATLECMYKYGGTLLQRGRFAEAESVLCKAFKLPQKANNPSMGYLTALLGRQYSRQGRYQEAEELLTEILGPIREAWGEHYGSTFHCVAALAENYARQGLTQEAEELLLDALHRSDRTDEPRPEVALQTLPYLGFFYLWQKRYDDAERCVGEALRASLDAYGREHPITLLCMNALGMVYREQGRYDEAETQLTKAADSVRDYCGGQSVHAASVMHHLAALYQTQGQYAEAEKLHLKTLDIQRNQLVENHPHTLGTIRGLIALYAAWHKPQEAQKWFNELKTAYASQSSTRQRTLTATGSVRYDPAGVYTLEASAPGTWAIHKELNFSLPEPTSGMWYIHDDLHFVHKRLHGDGSITAKIENISPAHHGTQAGVMIRNTPGPTSPHASIVITPSGDVVFEYRTVELGATHSTRSAINRGEFPHWVRLTRQGNRFTAQYSSDGVNWEKVQDSGSNEPTPIEVSMNEPVHIGLAVTSGSPTHSARARIAHVTVTGSATLSGPLTVSEDIGLHALDDPDDRHPLD